MIYEIDDNIKHLLDSAGGDLCGSGSDRAHCSVCGAEIRACEEFYDVDGIFFCMNCEEHAEKKILDIVRNDFIFEA